MPKPQRRGAIVILGMLALAKRGVVTDKVEVMLKMGLGPLGNVREFSTSVSSKIAKEGANRLIFHLLAIPALRSSV